MNAIRRAVIVDGNLADKRDHPDCEEIAQVSILLEKERAQLGKQSISRFSTILVEEAVTTNDPERWKAIVDDIFTKDLDVKSVHVLFSNNLSLPSLFISCLVTSKTREQILDMLVFFYEISPDIPQEVKEAIGVAITCQWKTFVNCLITVVSHASGKVKDVYFQEIGKFINFSQLSSESISCMIREIVKVKKTELLTVFLLCELKQCIDTELFDILLKTRSPKHTAVMMIARIINDTPDFIVSHQNAIEDMLTDTIRLVMRSGYCDQKILHSIAYISGKILDDNPVARNMATMLLWSTS